jgi:hypothetical protein
MFPLAPEYVDYIEESVRGTRGGDLHSTARLPEQSRMAVAWNRSPKDGCFSVGLIMLPVANDH